MTVNIDSPLGFRAEFPEHTLTLDESTGGPLTEQYGLPGNVLVTLYQDRNVPVDVAGANLWAHRQGDYYLNEMNASQLTEGALNGDGKEAYVVMLKLPAGDEEAPRIVSCVGMVQNGSFLGLVTVWPVFDESVEPRTELLREIVGSVTVLPPAS